MLTRIFKVQHGSFVAVSEPGFGSIAPEMVGWTASITMPAIHLRLEHADRLVPSAFMQISLNIQIHPHVFS